MSNYDSNPDNVSAVQRAINGAGYSPALAVDGAYGPKTIAGVKWFQGQHGLTQDGIIGDQTMAATVSTAPAGADPLAGLRAAAAALAAMQNPATPFAAPAAPLVAVPVNQLALKALTLRGLSAQPAVAAVSAAVVPYMPELPPTGLLPMMTPSVVAPAAVAPASHDPLETAPLVGVAAGVIVGALVRGAFGALLGGGVGAVAGLLYSFLSKPAPRTAFAGEGGGAAFGIDMTDGGFDLDYDAPEMISCEIGMPGSLLSMKG